ncbi:MAG: ribonuclease R, partial [Neisseria sp.]|nr:ribonuclease R [Neisseria sp.]
IMAIEGERSGVRFNMGDTVTVKVARADLDTSKIDLTLISGGSVGKKRGSRKAKPVSKPTATDKPVEKRKRKLSAKEIDEALAVPVKAKKSKVKSKPASKPAKPSKPKAASNKKAQAKTASVKAGRKNNAQGKSVKIKVKKAAKK